MNKIIINIALFSCTCLNAFTQTAGTGNLAQKGIVFERDLHWQQVKEKAKAENKYIFVDCFTTWCGPCKKMDADVYAKDSVGDYMNAKFISLKLQLDTSKQDNDHIKSCYAEASAIQREYKVPGYPTYLFFSPDGKIVNRGMGYKNPGDFIQLAANSLNPGKQYYTLIDNYRHGHKDYTSLPALSNIAQKAGDDSMAAVVALDYIDNYLLKLSDDKLYTKDNIFFITSFYKLLHSKTRAFDLFYQHAGKVDAAMNEKGFSVQMADYVIYTEDVAPAVAAGKNAGTEPDWNRIYANIKNKYRPDYAERNVVKGKVGWYHYKKDWKSYARYLVQQVEASGSESVVYLNNSAFEVFKFSDDKQELEKAISWAEHAMRLEPKPSFVIMDTKANLLYKLGRKEEGIALEEKALAVEPRAKDLQATLEKMKKGEETWK
jgi:thioredoxin-related protein